MYIKRIYKTIAIVFLLTVFCSYARCDDAAKKPEFYAILIGINEYADFTHLQGSIRDITSVRDVLLHNGVSKDHMIIMRSDDNSMLPTMTNIYRTLNSTLGKWKNQANPNDWLLFFYSGHGIQDDGKDYVVPMDAVKDYLSQWVIPTTRIEQSLRTNWRGEQFLCFFDMCRFPTNIDAFLNKLQEDTTTDKSDDSSSDDNSEITKGSSGTASTDPDEPSEAIYMSCMPSKTASDVGFLAKAFVSAISADKLDLGSFNIMDPVF